MQTTEKDSLTAYKARYENSSRRWQSCPMERPEFISQQDDEKPTSSIVDHCKRACLWLAIVSLPYRCADHRRRYGFINPIHHDGRALQNL